MSRRTAECWGQFLGCEKPNFNSLECFSHGSFLGGCWILEFLGLVLGSGFWGFALVFVVNTNEQQEFSLFCSIQNRNDFWYLFYFRIVVFSGRKYPTGLSMKYRCINFSSLLWKYHGFASNGLRTDACLSVCLLFSWKTQQN